MTNNYLEYCPNGNGPEDLRVLLHPFRPSWIIGNKTMCEMAAFLTEGKSCAEAGAILADRYGIDPESARCDVRRVESQLKAHSFLTGKDDVPERTPFLKSLFLYVTGRCNLVCSHCYYQGAHLPDFPWEAYRRIVDELATAGGQGLTLSGGEPLLHPQLREFLSYGNGRLFLSLLTNGTLLDKTWASFLAGLSDVRIQISLDGSCPEIHDAIRGEGTFKKVMRAVGYLQEAGLGSALTLCTTIMDGNRDDLPQIIELADKAQIPNVRFLPLRKRGRAISRWEGVGENMAVENYETFFNFVLDQDLGKTKRKDISCGLSGLCIPSPFDVSSDDHWCPVGHKVAVTPVGDAYPCVIMQTPEFLLGNIFREGLEAVAKSERMARLCAALGERPNKIENCAACLWKNFCQSGCMGEALEEHGTIWAKGKFCSCRKDRYEKVFRKLCVPSCD